MTKHYPSIARFMASHWATSAVHIVPVFGERGALLEHWVFCLFYNWPLTIRRRVGKRIEKRASIKPRYWHMPLAAVFGAAVFVAVDTMWFTHEEQLPTLRDVWYFTFLLPVFCGIVVTLAAGGLVLWKRFASATICGLAVGVLGILVTYNTIAVDFLPVADVIIQGVWRVFAMAIFATIGAILAEINLPDKELSA
jgi:hypothetical protein